MALNRDIGLVGLTFVAVGGIIGSGWLFAPLLAAKAAGPASLIAWAIGAFAMFLLAITFAEISAMIPVAGGIASVPQFSHGNVVSMAMGFTAWVGYNTTAPIEVEAMLKYIAPFANWLYQTPANETLSAAGVGTSIGLLILFVIINAQGVRFFAYINSTITWAKIAIPSLVAIVLISTSFKVENLTEYGGFAPMGIEGILAAVSSGGVIFSMIGFRHAIDLAGEVHNPKFTIPTALILSIVICFIIYGGLQIAFVGALSEDNLSQGWANIHFTAELGPLGAIAASVGLLWLVSLMNVSAVISPFGGALVAVGSNARLTMALSANKLIPRIFESLSENGVPLKALLLNLVISGGFLFLLPFTEIVALNGAAIVLSFVVGPIAVVALRSLTPDRPRSFKVPFIWITAPMAFVISTMVVYWSGWDTIWRLGVMLLFGLCLFFFRYRTIVRENRLDLKEAAWLLPYFFGLGVISYCGSFGGGLGILTFGWDILACALFGLFIFIFAVRSALSQKRFDAQFDEIAAELGLGDDVYHQLQI